MRPDTKETPDLVTFTKEIFDRKLHFLCSENEKLFLVNGWPLYAEYQNSRARSSNAPPIVN